MIRVANFEPPQWLPQEGATAAAAAVDPPHQPTPPLLVKLGLH
jgi:hypothetical protein